MAEALGRYEQLLYDALLAKGHKVVRQKEFSYVQHKVKKYIRVDLALPNHKLAIEVDGSGHLNATQKKADNLRAQTVQRAGWKYIRFDNDDVYNNLDWVVRQIESFCITREAASRGSGHAARGKPRGHDKASYDSWSPEKLPYDYSQMDNSPSYVQQDSAPSIIRRPPRTVTAQSQNQEPLSIFHYHFFTSAIIGFFLLWARSQQATVLQLVEVLVILFVLFHPILTFKFGKWIFKSFKNIHTRKKAIFVALALIGVLVAGWIISEHPVTSVSNPFASECRIVCDQAHLPGAISRTGPGECNCGGILVGYNELS